MIRCMLCYPFTHNLAEFLVIFGKDERQLHVCKWCLQDLCLFRFNANQIIRLPKQQHTLDVSLWFLGPVGSLLEASYWAKI
jgi:hypothetical protein